MSNVKDTSDRIIAMIRVADLFTRRTHGELIYGDIIGTVTNVRTCRFVRIDHIIYFAFDRLKDRRRRTKWQRGINHSRDSSSFLAEECVYEMLLAMHTLSNELKSSGENKE